MVLDVHFVGDLGIDRTYASRLVRAAVLTQVQSFVERERRVDEQVLGAFGNERPASAALAAAQAFRAEPSTRSETKLVEPPR